MEQKQTNFNNKHPLKLLKTDLETIIVNQETFDDFVLDCPRCGSQEIAKSGRSNGKPNYQCKECKRQFVHPLLKEEKSKKSKAPIENPDVYCYHCESQNRDFVYHGKDELGRARFYCNECKKWLIDPKQRFIHNIVCPKCNKAQCSKRGTSRSGKQKYYCPKCDYRFVENPQREFYGYNLSIGDDVWDARELGVKLRSYDTSHSKFVFTQIQQSWLKSLVKKFIKFRSATKAFGTLSSYLMAFNKFSTFLAENYLNITNIKQIDRELIIDYIHYLNRQDFKSQTVISHLGAIKLFFEDGNLNNWFKVSPHLIRLEDYPKTKKSLPRYIPEEVIKQLNQHLDKLPEQLMRMVLILQECGLRIGEALTLPFDCLRQDTHGYWFLFLTRHKMKKEQNIPISKELVVVIQEQQQYIRDNLGQDFNYLFCGRKKGATSKEHYYPEPKIMTPGSFSIYINRLAEEENITDRNGKVWRFQSHQFRHTVGTRMINNSIPQHIVQKYLGHESPTMTMVYAHIHDATLRKEIEKYHESRVVNFQGETIELEETILSSNDDLEWFKKNIQARALEHGYCARPKILGDCDIPGFDGCYNCPHWRTNKNFLSILTDTLDRTNKVIEKARNCGWELQVKKNEPIQHNLEKVIRSLKEEGNEQED
ncbi:MAG: tyrosine-type recombinase/integrase [Richelia sp. RM1_1_1]|nr:tyrosine-type recombinase/integrase [Richelia sp. RM1_1_1]